MVDKVLMYLFFCHRLPERSFFYRGKQFPICARCTGILIGYLLGVFYGIFSGLIPFYIAVLLIVPLGIDGVGQYLGYWVSTNSRRLITGILAGVGVDFLFYAIIKIGFNHGKFIFNYF